MFSSQPCLTFDKVFVALPCPFSFWKVGLANRIFSSSSAWRLSRDMGDVVQWWDVSWCNRFISKHSFVMWRTLLKWLPTQSWLYKFKIMSMSQCCFC